MRPLQVTQLVCNPNGTHLAAGYSDGRIRVWSIHSAQCVVTLNGHILGKPGNSKIAREMLAKLSGQTHQVMTAFVLLNETGQSAAAEVVTSEVTFKSISDAEIDAYLATGEPFDKAGAYAVQGKGRVLVDRVTGSLTNVIGLPMDEVGAALRTAGLLA